MTLRIASTQNRLRSLFIILAGIGLLLSSFAVVTPSSAAGAAAIAAPQASGQLAPAGGPIYKYLILPNTGGPVGCGDSLFAVYVGKRTGKTEVDVAKALKGLFSGHSKQEAGLYNPLYQSRLKVSKVTYNPDNRNVSIYTKGKFVRPSAACERKRIRAMVWKTAQQFPEISHAIIFTPSQLLGDLLVGGK